MINYNRAKISGNQKLGTDNKQSHLKINSNAKLLQNLIIFIVIFIGAGCTKSIKYKFDNIPIAEPDSRRQEMSVAVVPFKDIRPENEMDPGYYYSKKNTVDKMFKDHDITKGVAQAIVDHFNHVQLFKKTEMLDKSSMAPSPDIVEKANHLGYDALLTGKLKHFYGVGYDSLFDMVVFPFTVIPSVAIIALPITLIQDNNHKGFIEVIDLQLINTFDGSILWSDSVSQQNKNSFATIEPERIVIETLRDLIKKIVNLIESTEIKQFSNK